MTQEQRIALQMYTLRAEAVADFVGTLRKVAELGYQAVELAGMGGLTAPDLRKLLGDLGLLAPSSHISLDRIEGEPDAVIDETLALGCDYIVCPWIHPSRRGGADAWQALAETLNSFGSSCAAAGLQLCYHHHDFEFEQFDGRTALDIMLDSSDAALLKVEVDVYWAAYAGQDPVTLLRRLVNRVPLVHLKDMTAGPERDFAEVGSGVLDMPAILEATRAAGSKWLIVEQDRCSRPPLESVHMSFSYLRSKGL